MTERTPIEYDVGNLTFTIGAKTYSTAGLPSSTIHALSLRGLAAMIRSSKEPDATMQQVRDGVVFGRAGAKPRKSAANKSADRRAVEWAVAARAWDATTPKHVGMSKERGITSKLPDASAEVETWDAAKMKAFKRLPEFYVARAKIAADDAAVPAEESEAA